VLGSTVPAGQGLCCLVNLGSAISSETGSV
jgi:hypothetical protein